MEFDIADLLIDYVNYDGPKNVLIQWEQFSARPRHALQRAFFNNGLIESAKSKGFLYSEIQPFQIYEFLDQKGVGTPTLDTLVEELQLALNDIAGSPEEFMLDKQNLPENELLKLTSEIRGSLTIEELVENLFSYLLRQMKDKNRNELDERQIYVWRNRLPWATNEPKTLDAIGKELGVTRERIRQLQARFEKYTLKIDGEIELFINIENLLLEVSTYQEFCSAMVDDGLTGNQNFHPGQIRHLGIAMGQEQLVKEIEAAIYKWAS